MEKSMICKNVPRNALGLGHPTVVAPRGPTTMSSSIGHYRPTKMLGNTVRSCDCKAHATQASDAWKPSTASIDDTSARIIDRHMELFAKADANGDGVLNKEELRAVLESVGEGSEAVEFSWLTEDDLNAIFNQYDVDGNGLIDIDEFKKLVSDNVFLTMALEDYRRLFDALDTGGNGTVGPTELYQFFNKVESPLGDYEEICNLMSRFDLNHDGQIDFSEFLRLCRFEEALPDLSEMVQYAAVTPRQVVVEDDPPPVPGLAPGEVHSVSSEEQFKQILETEKDKTIVLFASLSWCRPCKKIAPKYDKCAKAYESVVFLKLLGNENDNTKHLFKEELQIRVTPAFFFFRNGALLGSCTGANTTKFETTMREHLVEEEKKNIDPLYPPEA
ncbi:hypothetical protein M9434_003455 [Picochlorum sp. BPE23]|nr:hypothetical protein M9434_003455 [Picochlorum sp. BPE23]